MANMIHDTKHVFTVHSEHYIDHRNSVAGMGITVGQVLSKTVWECLQQDFREASTCKWRRPPREHITVIAVGADQTVLGCKLVSGTLDSFSIRTTSSPVFEAFPFPVPKVIVQSGSSSKLTVSPRVGFRLCLTRYYSHTSRCTREFCI